MGRAIVSVAAAMVAACDPTTAIVEVPFGDHTGAALLALEIEGRVDYLALEKDTPFRLREEMNGEKARIAVSFFARTLADFGLPPGTLLPSGPTGDALPAALEMIEANVDASGSVTPWAPATRTDTFDAIRTISQPCGAFVADRPRPLGLRTVSGMVALSSTATLVVGAGADFVDKLILIGADGTQEVLPTPGLQPTSLASAGSRIYLGGSSVSGGVIHASDDGRTFTPLHVVPGTPARMEPAPEEGTDVLYVQIFGEVRRVAGTGQEVVGRPPRETWTHVGPREIVARSGTDVERIMDGRSMFEEVTTGEINYVSALKHVFSLDRTFAAATGGLLFGSLPVGWEFVGQTPLTFETKGLALIPDALLLASFGGEVTEFLFSSNLMCAATSWNLGANANIAFISVVRRSVAVVYEDKSDNSWAFARSELVPGRR